MSASKTVTVDFAVCHDGVRRKFYPLIGRDCGEIAALDHLRDDHRSGLDGYVAGFVQFFK